MSVSLRLDTRPERPPSLRICRKLALVCLTMMAGCEGRQAPAPKARRSPPPSARTVEGQRPSPPATGYVGSTRCAECHTEISAVYAEHPMARSAGIVSEMVPVEDFQQAGFTAGMLHYSVEATADGVVHREAMLAGDGTPIYEQAEPIRYAIGSGQRGRSYLIDREGLLFESPLTWYSAHQRWDLSPGYDKINQHFDRQVGDGCVMCHVGTPQNPSGERDRFASPMFLEAGIGCERCHGPGRDHIDFRTARSSNAAVAEHDPIVNPRNLTDERREAVCNQCHLQGDERILRYGRRDADFRPGDALHDVWISFTRGTRVFDGVSTEAVSQVEQMHSSACYQNSQGRFGCISCHDPHRMPTAAERIEYYGGKCLACHTLPHSECSETLAARQAAGGACIDCHMPRLSAADVPHTSQTDHRVPRRRTTEAPTADDGNSPFQVFGAAEQQVPAWEIERARGLLMVDYAERKHDRLLAAEASSLLKPLVTQVPDDPILWTRLGVAYELSNFPDHARHAWEQAVRVDERLLEPRRRLAIHLFDQHSPTEALSALEEFHRRNPWDQRLCGRLILARAAQGQSEAALELAQQSVKRFPASEQFHRWLAGAYRSRGQSQAGEQHEMIADQLEKNRRP